MNQDVENQLGGDQLLDKVMKNEITTGEVHALADEPAGDAVKDNAKAKAPQGDGANPRDQLKADALELIISARRLGRDPLELVTEVLESIKD